MSKGSLSAVPTSTNVVQKTPDEPPPYEPRKETILFIASLFSSGDYDCRRVKEFLERIGFHVIAPNLTAEQLSNSNTAILFLAGLIKTPSGDGRAHVIGLSVCANLAFKLATAYPDLVASVIIFGPVVCLRFFQPLLVLPIYVVNRMVSRRMWATKFILRQCYSISKLLGVPENLESLKAKTTIIMQSQDFTIFAAMVLRRKLCSCPVLVRELTYGGGHFWNRANPKLFAKTIVASITNVWPQEVDVEFL